MTVYESVIPCTHGSFGKFRSCVLRMKHIVVVWPFLVIRCLPCCMMNKCCLGPTSMLQGTIGSSFFLSGPWTGGGYVIL